MAEMNGAAPTRPFGQEPPTVPSTEPIDPTDRIDPTDPTEPVDPQAPAKDLALMRLPGELTAPDPSDLRLFADMPEPVEQFVPHAELAYGRNRPDGYPSGGTSGKGGSGGATGDVGSGGGTRSPEILPAPRPMSGRPPGRRPSLHPPADLSRSARLATLIGVVALVCGVVLVVAARPESRDGQAAAPVTGEASIPALRGSPPAAAGNPPGADDSADQSPPAADSAATDARPGSTVTRPPGAAAANASGTAPDNNKNDSGRGTEQDDGKSGDSGGNKPDGQGGTGSGPVEDSGPGPSTGPGTGTGTGTGGGEDEGEDEGGSAGGQSPAPSSRELAVQAVNYPQRYWHVRGDNRGYLDTVSPSAATFEVVSGLADSGCYSFSLGNGRYLRHLSYRLRADADDGSDLFKRDSTFCPRPAQQDGTVMLESHNYPGRFIRHRDFHLRLDTYQNTALYRADSTFRMVNG